MLPFFMEADLVAPVPGATTAVPLDHFAEGEGIKLAELSPRASIPKHVIGSEYASACVSHDAP
jgi:hypothetical protein